MTASPSVSFPWKQLGDFEGDKLVSIAFTVAVFSGNQISLSDNSSGVGAVQLFWKERKRMSV